MARSGSRAQAASVLLDDLMESPPVSALVEVNRCPIGREGQPYSPHLPRQGNGYVPVYWAGEINRCPGCGMSQWIIGRMTAECAFCATAVPLQHTGLEGSALGGIYWDREAFRHGWNFGGSHKAAASGTADWEQ